MSLFKQKEANVNIDTDKLSREGLDRLSAKDRFGYTDKVERHYRIEKDEDVFVPKEEFDRLKEQYRKEMADREVKVARRIKISILSLIICVCACILLYPEVKKVLDQVVERAGQGRYEANHKISDDEAKELIKDIEITSVGASGDIVYGDSVTSANANYAYNIWYMIPTPLRTEFTLDGWKVSIITGDMATLFPEHAGAEALTVVENKMIYIEDRQKAFRDSLVHEFGHYLDIKEDRVSQSDDFKALYDSEKGYLYEVDNYNNNGISNSTEYFAECFEQYVMYPELLQETCPQTYEYIGNIVEKYKTDVK